MPHLSRRSFVVLTAGVATLGAAGCARDDRPDELEAPWTAARADAALATAAAGAFPDAAARLTPVADARRTHAEALAIEIRRARPDRAEVLDAPPPAVGNPSSAADAVAALTRSLGAARDAGAALAVTTARYRAGLVASVAASCAGWAEALAS
ncbi:hypothetical protein [Actinomycetospora soli]|uniref:hypothetical protein n=1 Tax=Actinomycetospora soli TaxID=2893887 RepID=UPI001E34145A|nr:hypothetical protein [Actinomycetospora soli]MCD2189651.1 hypothetical protein [Actinomycetospora soli]